MTDPAPKIMVRATVRAFRIPPVHDALVIGRDAPIGVVALHEALRLIVNEEFSHLPADTDNLDILVRSAILRRLPPERLRRLVSTEIEPLMTPQEILHLDLFPEVSLEAAL